MVVPSVTSRLCLQRHPGSTVGDVIVVPWVTSRLWHRCHPGFAAGSAGEPGRSPKHVTRSRGQPSGGCSIGQGDGAAPHPGFPPRCYFLRRFYPFLYFYHQLLFLPPPPFHTSFAFFPSSSFSLPIIIFFPIFSYFSSFFSAPSLPPVPFADILHIFIHFFPQ